MRYLRLFWVQLTSMRTALLLLFTLALVAPLLGACVPALIAGGAAGTAGDGGGAGVQAASRMKV